MNALEHRIPPPFVCLLILLAMGAAAWLLPVPVLAVDRGLRIAVGVAVGAAGLATLLAGAVTFRRIGTTIDPVTIDRASVLCTSGPFAYTRNPVYVGMTLVLLGWLAFLAAPWTALGPLAFVLFIDRFQIAPEERAMRARFGAEYDAYCRRVRRWV